MRLADQWPNYPFFRLATMAQGCTSELKIRMPFSISTLIVSMTTRIKLTRQF